MKMGGGNIYLKREEGETHPPSKIEFGMTEFGPMLVCGDKNIPITAQEYEALSLLEKQKRIKTEHGSTAIKNKLPSGGVFLSRINKKLNTAGASFGVYISNNPRGMGKYSASVECKTKTILCPNQDCSTLNVISKNAPFDYKITLTDYVKKYH